MRFCAQNAAKITFAAAQIETALSVVPRAVFFVAFSGVEEPILSAQ
jgi:hypothetical protein